jgi:amino acid transporter
VGQAPRSPTNDPDNVDASSSRAAAAAAPEDDESSPAEKERQSKADHVVSIFMERVYGPLAAKLFTILLLWTIVASAFALLLGYSRIPYAAAKDGYFFSIFARLHPTKSFPHVSLLVIGVLSIACSAIPLDAVIEVLLAMRILVQFMGQSFAVIRLRRTSPAMERPYRVWLYPLPNLVALAGFLFVFATNALWVILLALGMLAAGVGFFLVWSRLTHRWPFGDEKVTG